MTTDFSKFITPEPIDKFITPKEMSDREKGFWLGMFIGALLANLIWLIIL